VVVKSAKVAYSAVTEAYIENEKSLGRYLRRFLDRPEDVQDALHETYVKACRSHEISPIDSPKAFLFTVARNIALNELARHGNSRTTTVSEFDHLDGHTSHGHADEQAAAEERLDFAVRAIASMSPRVRDAFVLRKVHGYRQKEIAKQLGISESTVEKHIARGMAVIMEFQGHALESESGPLNGKKVNFIRSGDE
jgi:RNA polymerase sigma factor (sigma-70 family)